MFIFSEFIIVLPVTYEKLCGSMFQSRIWFMNRADYLDPALAWTGVKDSGRGCSLSRVGYEQLTRPKSFHLRTAI